MKVIKRILFSILLSILIFNLFTIYVLSASDDVNNIKIIEEEQMSDNVLYQYYNMDTSFKDKSSKMTRDVYTYTLKQNQYAHLATWTYSSPDDYTLKDLQSIAYDYELNHPGWVVLGGINAEGYYNGELTNAFIQDGDVIRKDVSAEAFKKLIGFKDDGSVVIKQVPQASENPLLKVDNECYDVKKVNELPLDDEIAVITNKLNNTLNVSEYNVIECTYSLYRTSEEFPNPNKTHSGSFLGIFLKGVVNKQVTFTTISKSNCSNKKFYIVTKQSEILDVLITGKNIKIEFDYIDEFKDVISMTGYMYQYLKDGKTIPDDYVETNDVGEKVDYNCAYYKSTSKERAGIGFKADGSIVLLTTNTKTGGPTQYEVGEIFKELGCTDAYQFDGGGSVTFLKRDKNGNIEMKNTPGDGIARSIMSGLFIVARDIDVNCEPIEVTESSIELSVSIKEENLSKLQINLYKETNNGRQLIESLEPINNNVKFENLNSDTNYFYNFSYKLEGNDKLVDSYLYHNISTYKSIPNIRKVLILLKDDSYHISLDYIDANNAITGYIKISFNNGNTWNNIPKKSSLKLSCLEVDIMQNIIIEYRYYTTTPENDYKITLDDVYVQYTLEVYFESIVNSNNNFVLSCLND